MDAPYNRSLPLVLMGLCLVLGMACKRPETAIRKRPIQRVELIQTVNGMTPEEERAVLAQLAERLGLPADLSAQTAESIRVFRLTLSGRPDRMMGRGLGKTCLVSTGLGVLAGALLPAVGGAVWATWRSAAIAAGTGGLLGLGYGPTWYKRNEALQQQVGYLPWDFTAEWEVLERRSGRADEVVARSGNVPPFFGYRTPILDLKPYLKPLPTESRSEVDVRQASLKAYVEALVMHFQKKD